MLLVSYILVNILRMQPYLGKIAYWQLEIKTTLQ